MEQEKDLKYSVRKRNAQASFRIVSIARRSFAEGCEFSTSRNPPPHPFLPSIHPRVCCPDSVDLFIVLNKVKKQTFWGPCSHYDYTTMEISCMFCELLLRSFSNLKFFNWFFLFFLFFWGGLIFISPWLPELF